MRCWGCTHLRRLSSKDFGRSTSPTQAGRVSGTSDTFTAQLPTLPSAANGEVTIKVEFRDDPVFEIRAETERERIILDGEIDGESVTFRLPEATEILWVRLCTSDWRCANYQARVEQ